MARQSVGSDYDDLLRILKSFPQKRNETTYFERMNNWRAESTRRVPAWTVNGRYGMQRHLQKNTYTNKSIVNWEIQRMSVGKKKKK